MVVTKIRNGTECTIFRNTLQNEGTEAGSRVLYAHVQNSMERHMEITEVSLSSDYSSFSKRTHWPSSCPLSSLLESRAS